MSNLNELAIIDPKKMQLIPNPDEIAAIRDELADIDRVPFGRIKIAGGGAGVFNVTEAGDEDDDAKAVNEIVGVILFSHKTNAYWAEKYGESDDVTPTCASMNGDEGTVTETQELLPCDKCPNNQFGINGSGKACKNMRRLYIMRDGDMFPLILTLPPTSLGGYDKFRTKILLGRKPMQSVLVKITLKSDKNPAGIKYSKASFEAVGILPPDEAQRVKAYAAEFSGAAQRVGIKGDDANAAEQTNVGYGNTQQTNVGYAPDPDIADEFIEMSESDVDALFGGKGGTK